jgi:hypothetical protein
MFNITLTVMLNQELMMVLDLFIVQIVNSKTTINQTPEFTEDMFGNIING